MRPVSRVHAHACTVILNVSPVVSCKLEWLEMFVTCLMCVARSDRPLLTIVVVLQEEFDRLTAQGAIDGEAGPAVGSMGAIEQVTWRNAICKSRHPGIAFAHVFFKSSALTLYFFQKLFGIQYVTLFVLTVLLMACDFWVVKNLSGRLLVGLRWWSKVIDGKEVWIYEASPQANQLPALDRRIFWWPTYLTPIIWGVFALLSFISFSWEYLPLHLVAAGLSGSNALGYIRCSGDAQRRLQASLTAGALTGLNYVPGALPALGSTMLNILRAQSGAAPVPAAGATASPLPLPAAGMAAGAVAMAMPVGGAGAAPARSPLGGVGGSISDFDAVADPFGSRAPRSSSSQGGGGRGDGAVTI